MVMNSLPTSQSAVPADRRDLAIGVLAITAVVLFVALFLTERGSGTAFADGMSVSGGDYVFAVGGAVLADEDFAYIVDVPMERIIAYRFDAARQQIEVVQGIELAELRKDPSGLDPSGTTQQPSTPRRRP
jgi:hypothetical protein